VQNGMFHIATMGNIADGVKHLMGYTLDEINHRAEGKLSEFKLTLEMNLPKRHTL